MKISVGTRLLIFLLCALCVLCGESSAQDFKTVHDGVEYAQVVHKLGSDPVKINLLRLDLKKVRLDVHHAMDAAIGTEKTSSIATRHGAVAAINAGFFRLDKSAFAGDTVGSLVIDGELFSESLNDRVGLILLNTSEYTLFAEIEHPRLYARVYSTSIEFPEIRGTNRERRPGEIILYSDKFGASTLTVSAGTEIVIAGCKRTFCNKIDVFEGKGNLAIPSNGFVLSIDSRDGNAYSSFVEKLKLLSLRRKKERVLQVQPAWAGISPLNESLRKGSGLYITNGIPQLIKNAKIDITWEQEKASKAFAETRHPRTAVAKLKDGKFLMITVDGRQPGVSVGMNLQELAEYLLSLGAVDAMNLDGGGSTTMFLDGKVVNTPSDKAGERKIGDAILVTLRKKVSGKK